MRIAYLPFLPAFILMSVMFGSIAKAESMSDFEGFKIQFDESEYREVKAIEIRGAFATFVKCGSQYAIWSQFPGAIRYSLKDLDSNKIYQSANGELSISWDGSQVYDEYAKMPCDKVIEKEFSTALNDIYFVDSPKKAIRNFELHADYAGHTSNVIVFDKRPFFPKGF